MAAELLPSCLTRLRRLGGAVLVVQVEMAKEEWMWALWCAAQGVASQPSLDSPGPPALGPPARPHVGRSARRSGPSLSHS